MIQINEKDADEIANYLRGVIKDTINELSEDSKKEMLFENNILSDDDRNIIKKLEEITGIKYSDYLREELKSNQEKVYKLQRFILILTAGSECEKQENTSQSQTLN